MQSIVLNKGWEFKGSTKPLSLYRAVSQFPTNIHLDLLSHGLIPDPFIAKNAADVQWVGEDSWIYRLKLRVPRWNQATFVDLIFEGLDTYAVVSLNDVVIHLSTDMFQTYRASVKHLLRPELNEITILFGSTWEIAKGIAGKTPDHLWSCWNGDPSRLAVRKAQFHYGWDWGPKLMTCGPWRPIRMELHHGRISNLDCQYVIGKNFETAEITITASVKTPKMTNSSLGPPLSNIKHSIKFTLHEFGIPASILEETQVLLVQDAVTKFVLQRPKLWFPKGYGAQSLYEVTATLFALYGPTESTPEARLETIASETSVIGLRKVELIQRPVHDSEGQSFFFRVNGIPIFCAGSNWIPADSFSPRIGKEKYRSLVKLAADGNQNMLRVWGGGIYEDSEFYKACNELGIMVWQDFMFACGNYPAKSKEFRDRVQCEAKFQVRRLRHHPCIAIWAGNNEDYQIMEAEKLEYDPNEHDPNKWLETSFPARYIYENLLPEVLRKELPGAIYHFGSPWGGKDTRDPTAGDIHQWNVWHESQEMYQNFDKLTGRFVSEFGMQAFPSIKTVDSFLESGSLERFSQSSTMDFHNKAAGQERRLATYLAENLRYSFEPIEHYIYCTQLMQAECLSAAYRAFRREWRGSGKEYCGGSLVWQFNDCWPCISWSIIDYYLRPKLGYFAIKRELQPLVVEIKRKMHPSKGVYRTGDRKRCAFDLEIWACNSRLESREVSLKVEGWTVTGTRVFKIYQDVPMVQGNSSTELLSTKVLADLEGSDGGDQVAIAAYLFERDRQVARMVNWPEPLRYVHLAREPVLQIRLLDSSRLEVSAKVPVKGVALEIELDKVVFQDNGFDLVPEERFLVGVEGLKNGEERQISFRHLGAEGSEGIRCLSCGPQD